MITRKLGCVFAEMGVGVRSMSELFRVALSSKLPHSGGEVPVTQFRGQVIASCDSAHMVTLKLQSPSIDDKFHRQVKLLNFRRYF